MLYCTMLYTVCTCMCMLYYTTLCTYTITRLYYAMHTISHWIVFYYAYAVNSYYTLALHYIYSYYIQPMYSSYVYVILCYSYHTYIHARAILLYTARTLYFTLILHLHSYDIPTLYTYIHTLYYTIYRYVRR